MAPLSHDRHLAAMPMHLTLAMLPWLASSAALRLSKSESAALSQAVGMTSAMPGSGGAAKLNAMWLQVINDKQFARAVECESRRRAAEFLEGLLRYQKARYERDTEEPPCVFSRGSARLLDYGGSNSAPVVVIVPSLINRYYILDLTRRLSFARFLKSEGMRVFIVDWGSPSALEKSYSCGMYVSEHLIPMMEWIRHFSKGPLVAAGYCMGGLLTLALGNLCPDMIDGMACFATPWDFSVPEFPKVALPEETVAEIGSYIDSGETLPAETINILFNLASPFAFQTKMREFLRVKEGSQAEEDFLAIEQWVQDGVPMAAGVARDCLIEWPHHNTPANRMWRVGGRIISPESLRMPVFVAVPQGDRIVPAASALPLVKRCKNATLIEPSAGHVSMIVGKNRRSALWDPFVNWVDSQVA